MDLSEIVTGTKTREYLEKFLDFYPYSYHPADIERLDHFIISLYRYKAQWSRSKLEEYLEKDLKWETMHVIWCVNRIEAGLGVLASRKSFGQSFVS